MNSKEIAPSIVLIVMCLMFIFAAVSDGPSSMSAVNLVSIYERLVAIIYLLIACLVGILFLVLTK